MNYWQGEGMRRLQTAAPTRGRIARYAWGDDYHEVLEKKLRALDGFLTAAGGRQKFYVDTGPVLERDFAAEAGIGWHGKSTMLLNRQLRDLVFPRAKFSPRSICLPIRPQVARCGSLHALHRRLPDRRNHCAASAGRAPLHFLPNDRAQRVASRPSSDPLIGDRIFGCDDCLDACPWNRFAQISRESAFAARPAVAQMRLRDFLALDDEQFRALFRGSPIKRIKRRGFLRNVCVALGNVGTNEGSAGVAPSGAGPRTAGRGARGMGHRANRADLPG